MHQGLLGACVAVPESIVCLVSALSYCGLTTPAPDAVEKAIPWKA